MDRMIIIIFIFVFVFSSGMLGSLFKNAGNKNRAAGRRGVPDFFKKKDSNGKGVSEDGNPSKMRNFDKAAGFNGSLFKGIEDRENDWLAMQLRDEKRSEVKYSAMYGLKKAHYDNCDAKKIRINH